MPRLFRLLGVCALAIGVLLGIPAAAQGPTGLRLDRAAFAQGAGESPPADARWIEVALPDRWDAGDGRSGGGWYRLHFDLPALPGEPWGLYLPRAGNAIEVRINDRRIMRLGIDATPPADWSRRPLYAPFPDDALRAGTNEVLVRLQVQAGRGGGLSALQIGPDAELSSRWARRQAVVVWSTLGVAGTIGALGMVALALWARLRDALYLYFGAGSMLWAIRLVAILTVVPPIPSLVVWEALLWTLYGTYIAMMALFALRVAGFDRSAARPLVLAYLCINPVVCVLAQWAPDLGLQGPWQGVHIAVSVLIGVMVLIRALRRPDVEVVLLAAGIGASVLAGLHDWFQYWHRSAGYEAVLLARHVSLVFFATMAWILVDRFSKALRDYAQLNAELETRIVAAEHEIARQYTLLREADRGATRQAERERIVRDLHDGIGGQLVLLAQRAADERMPRLELAEHLRDVLLQMRLSIESLDASDGDLAAAIANVRHRFGERLRGAGVACDWRIDALPPLPALQASGVLDVQRILLEAMTNAVRHGRARRIEIAVVHRDGELLLTVSDDGEGFDPTTITPGRGLNNMRRRARDLGGTLTVDATPSGVRVSLVLPTAPHAVPNPHGAAKEDAR